jgi:gamma-glutamyltranspeptidase/glutathione hydrolase
MGPGVLDELRRRGHDVVEAPPWSIGRICAVGVDPESRFLTAAASPRFAQAYAIAR